MLLLTLYVEGQLHTPHRRRQRIIYIDSKHHLESYSRENGRSDEVFARTPASIGVMGFEEGRLRR